MTTSEKQHALDIIAQQIAAFKDLEIARTAIKSVPGEGSPDADLFFIGEAPGAQEDATGRPFVGLSGQLLTKVLLKVTGLNRQQVFITSVVKYRPPQNRDPSIEEISACNLWLDEQIKIIQPKIIVTLGRFSMAKFIPGVTISQVHGQPKSVHLPWQTANQSTIVFPMYHPAAALRSTQMLKAFEADFLILKNLLDQIKAAS